MSSGIKGAYPAPFEEEGPELRADSQGRRCWRYMYASWVLTWPEHSSTVTVEHGTIDGPGNLHFPGRSFTITEPWARETLARVGREWARAEERRFRRPPRLPSDPP